MQIEIIKLQVLKLISFFVFLLIILVPMKTVLYLFCEFVLCVNTYTSPLSISEEKAIPKRIHQVFFFETSSTLPNEFMKSQQTCQKHHSSYMYTLWNKTMINDLIEKEYPEFKQIYDSYDHWVKRVDAGRYLVLHHYGGWYIDIDIVCKRSVDELSAEARAKNASVVVYKTKPVGFTNAVIGISRQHQYLNDVIVALRHSKRWYFIPYLSTMFTTGPTFLLGRYLNYPYKDEFHIINNHERYFHHLHGSAWHSLDGDIIMYIFNNSPRKLTFIVCACTVINVILYSKRRNKNKFSAFQRNV